jgi:heparin binding hemagglutinin HbhA
VALAAQIRKTLTDTTPLYAVAGAGDLAVDRVRRRVTALRGALEPKVVRDGVATLRSDVASLPAKTRAFLPGRLDRAEDAYAGLATRGRDVIDRIRRGRPVQEILEEAGRSVRRNRAARARDRPGCGRGGRGSRGAARRVSEWFIPSAAVRARRGLW